MTERVRINLEIAPKVAKQWSSVQKRSGAATRTETLRKAIKLFDRLLECEEAGGNVVIRYPDGSEARLMIL